MKIFHSNVYQRGQWTFRIGIILFVLSGHFVKIIDMTDSSQIRVLEDLRR